MAGEDDGRREKHVNEVISGVAKEVMLSIFGRRGLESIIKVMKGKYGLDLDDIPEKPHTFSEALREIIGIGSVIIEDLIIENLYIKVGLELRLRKNYNFPDYINEVKNHVSLNPRKVSE
ncbi:MAG: hypothetical protein QXK89_09250 [Candidatus Bathyarchaeia archaeon]|nr:hypothetical protein [Candidatus Bathyarchaeota archaeon]